jgi:murein DD-endopeptidase MepM/ murein hydrolase activator NlpD
MIKRLLQKVEGIFFISMVCLFLMAGLLYIGQEEAKAPAKPEQRNQAQLDQEKVNQEKEAQTKTKDPKQTYTLSLHHFQDRSWISLDDLLEQTKGAYNYDELNGVLTMEVFQVPFMWVKDVPVAERNGIYLPFEWSLLIEDKKIYLPLEFVSKGLEMEVVVDQEHDQASFVLSPETKEVVASLSKKPLHLKELNETELIDFLSFLTNPIPNAVISTKESHLPGARRAYRNGYHEGIDWYGGTSGRPINNNTPILSIADGVVVRADTDYVEFEKSERDEYLTWAKKQEKTPTFLLDMLRGRQVWVQYEHGVMMRFAHLSGIEEGIVVGKKVQRGETLGYVGNSGTSYAVNHDPDGGLHLHADLLIYGELFWKHINESDKVRHILQEVFKE